MISLKAMLKLLMFISQSGIAELQNCAMVEPQNGGTAEHGLCSWLMFHVERVELFLGSEFIVSLRHLLINKTAVSRTARNTEPTVSHS